MNLLNQFANRNKRLIHELEWSDCSCSRVDNSLIQMIRLERVFSELNSLIQMIRLERVFSELNSLIQMIRLKRVFSELNSQVKNREILWARVSDAAKSKLLMSNFRINYCN